MKNLKGINCGDEIKIKLPDNPNIFLRALLLVVLVEDGLVEPSYGKDLTTIQLGKTLSTTFGPGVWFPMPSGTAANIIGPLCLCKTWHSFLRTSSPCVNS